MTAATPDLFSPPPVVAGVVKPMRPYQATAYQNIREKLAAHRSTLVVLATGGGKTRIAGEVIREWPGKRCLFLAHRDELIQQAVDRIGELIGAPPEVEMAESAAGRHGRRPVIASVQSLTQPRRLHRFKPDDFDLIVTDEVHHGCAPTYRRIYDYFAAAKMLGLTATPDRADGLALGQIMESVAFRYELPEMIADGWLAPIKILQVHIDSLDFSTLHTRAGDFRKEELDALLAQEKNLHGIAAAIVERAASRKTAAFTSNVANAHSLSEIINRYSLTGRSAVVDGEMDRDERRRVLDAFRSGDLQYVVNCNVLTEGFDEPSIECVAMARPTKSRTTYAQQIGRGTRLSPGKDYCLVLDFTGNSGRHEVVCAADLLGGKMSPAELADAKKILAKAKGAMTLEEAAVEGKKAAEKKAARRKMLDEMAKAKRAALTADRVEHSAHEVDGISQAPEMDDGAVGDAPSAAMLRKLEQMMGGKGAPFARWRKKNPKATRGEVGWMIGLLTQRMHKGLCTYAQLDSMRKIGLKADSWTKAQVSRIQDWRVANNWQRPPADVLARLLGGAT